MMREISFELTSLQYRKVRRKADRAGLSVEEYVRLMMLYGNIDHNEPPAFDSVKHLKADAEALLKELESDKSKAGLKETAERVELLREKIAHYESDMEMLQRIADTQK